MTGAYRCNLVVPGFPKSGTSSFHEYLAQHPDVCMSRPKEIHHFTRSDRWAGGVEAHNAIFSHAEGTERYFGESSTTYCIWPEAGERIKAHLRSPKVILLMRHPVERAISHYAWMHQLGLESRPLREALHADGDSFHPDHNLNGNYRGYLIFSRYADHVPRWELLFGAENVLTLRTADLATSPASTLARAYDFLGLAPHTLVRTERVNQTRDQRPIGHRRWAAMLRPAIPDRAVQSLKRVPGLVALWSHASRPGVRRPPTITQDDRAWLEEELRDHIHFYHERA